MTPKPPEVRLLLVDDDDDDRLLTRTLLQQVKETNYLVESVNNYDDGLKAIIDNRHDAYLIDHRLGGRTGLLLLQALGPERTRERPILMLTGTANRETDLQAMQAGAADFLVKGRVGPSELDRSIRYARQRAAMLRELRQQAQELSRSNADLEAFARSVSHDLKGPLTSILAHLELIELESGGALPPEARQSLELAQQSCLRMNRCIDDLLQSAALGPSEARMRAVDPALAIQAALELHAEALAASGGRVEIAPLPLVQADPIKLEQLFRNLIGNAIKFAGDAPPRLEIHAEPHGERVLLRLRDHGIGVPPGERERVFELGGRASNARELPGSGLGLAICRRIARQNGGDLRLQCPEDGGTELLLWLPSPSAGGEGASGATPTAESSERPT